MPFPVKKFSSLAYRLVDNTLYTFKSSSYLSYLSELRSIRQTVSPPSRHHKYKLFLLSRLLFYAYVVFIVLRGVYIAVLLARGGGTASLTAHAYIDPFPSLAIRHFEKIFNSFTIGVVCLFGGFFIFIDVSFCFALDGTIVDTLTQLAFLNSERFFALNSHLQVPKVDFLSPLESFAKGRSWLKTMWNPPEDSRLIFAHAHLDGFPNLSARTRSRLVLLGLLAEWACSGVYIYTALPTIGMDAYFIHQVYQQFGFHYITLLCFLDQLALTVAILINSSNLCFVFYGVSFPLLMTSQHTAEMNQSLKQLLERLEKAQKAPKPKKVPGSEVTRSSRRALYRSRLEASLRRQLSFFYTEHRALQYLQQRLNDNVASNLLLSTLLVGVVCQIVLSNLLLLQQLTWQEKAICLVVIGSLSGMILQLAQVTITWTEALYSGVGHLYKAQSLLMGSQGTAPARGPYFARGQYFEVLSAKLHLMAYYELLCTDEKLLFTVGQLGSISKFSLYEFFYAYTGFFMFITMFMKDLSGSSAESADGYSLEH